MEEIRAPPQESLDHPVDDRLENRRRLLRPLGVRPNGVVLQRVPAGVLVQGSPHYGRR